MRLGGFGSAGVAGCDLATSLILAGPPDGVCGTGDADGWAEVLGVGIEGPAALMEEALVIFRLGSRLGGGGGG